MKRIELEELKSIQVEILSKVHNFCVKNNIRYSLTAGTLLGAIRHKGYIPWDDDIDIAMPRPDYDRFLNSFNGVYPDSYVIAPELNWNFYAPYANVCDNRTIVYESSNGHRGIDMGIKIDIFPIDGVPSDYPLYMSKLKRIQFINKILWGKRFEMNQSHNLNFTTSLKILAAKALFSFRSYASYQKELNKIARCCPFEISNYAHTWVFSAIENRFKREIFEEFVSVQFEGGTYIAIKDYDVWLTALYQDYMELPPIEQRVAHHHFAAYWR